MRKQGREPNAGNEFFLRLSAVVCGTDECFKYFSDKKKLWSLNIYDSNITSKGLDHLTGCDGLWMFDLATGADIGEQAQMRFKRKMPYLHMFNVRPSKEKMRESETTQDSANRRR